MLLSSDFDYHLPPELIAQQPVSPRDHSRLLVVDRASGSLSHHYFYELPQLLKKSDVLVRNNTKVFPARLIGVKENGGKIELLLIKRVHENSLVSSPVTTPNSPDTKLLEHTWQCLTKPGLKLGQQLSFGPHLRGRCVAITGYTRSVQFELTPGCEFWEEVQKQGITPLPPYIHSTSSEAQLRLDYQTTYAQVTGSAAAPTAGLHFTPDLDTQLQYQGVDSVEVTLHVGLGTFLPVKTEQIADHQMHEECYQLSQDTATRLNLAKAQGQRIIAVGTTTTRVLESSPQPFVEHADTTSIYMYPPYQFQAVDSLLTNFHQPKSTLLMLVSAFVSAPNTNHPFTTFANSIIGKAYQAAIDNKYRFHSFGDAMLIL